MRIRNKHIWVVTLILIKGLICQDIDFKSWKYLPDNAFIDSLKKYEGKYYKLGDYEYRNEGENYKAPIISKIYRKFPKNFIPKGFDLNEHFQEYLDYFKTLNLYGIDPFRLYYHKINIKRIDEFKKAGYSITKAYNYIYLPNLDAETNWGLFNNSSLMIGVCKKIIRIDENMIHHEFVVTDIIKDRYNYYKKGNLLKSPNHLTIETLYPDSKNLLNRKKINISDTCLLMIDRFYVERQVLSFPDNIEVGNPYSNVGFTKIKNGKYGTFKGKEEDLKKLIDDCINFERINDTQNFYTRSYK